MGKNLKKMLLSLLAVFALAMVMQSSAEASGEVTQVGCADSTITIQWSAPTLYSYETLTGYFVYDSTTGIYLTTSLPASSTSATFTISTGKGYVAHWMVGYYSTISNGSSEGIVGYSYVNTTPATYTTSQFGPSALYSLLKKVSFKVQYFERSTGTTMKIYQLSNGKLKKSLTASYSWFNEDFNYKENTAYKYRVQSYYTNDTNAQTYSGSWSKYRYFAIPSGKLSYSKASSGVKVTVKKGSGIIKYKLQISTKKDSGYKTVKTIKVGKKSKYSYTIKKCNGKKLKKGKYYYVRIVPVLKGNKKSDGYAQQSVYFSR